ncbi:MspA protein [Mycolicibacterium wolinskyi]|uniref:MspA protein n=1 Tax=Mycolicibacterium wolinskyi TaxID=59750 RepID=A0A132PCN7_9MYCO|nr:MspA family porin [Mycolicibacterium wolinskyi]KWX20098.1 MspA protein [Mycolicibacterium wolinskyi]
MLIRPLALLTVVVAYAVCAPQASADPEADVAPPQAEPAIVVGLVESTPPATTKTPDGWELTVSARDETQAVVAPLTTAVSSREYVVGGTYVGKMAGPDIGEESRGALEAGYQIGCGIDMSTSNGVSLTGTAGINPSIGVIGTDVISPLPEGILPGIGGNIGGGITVGLKPGIINVVPVAEKQFEGTDPWVMISNFRVKIDGCVGQSFIRSYAILTRSTDESEAVLAWYGVTKVV